MISTIEDLIKEYKPKTLLETKNALREILQSIILIGLSRGGFFNEAAFYGGTALRIFYGLNRYSEDLDFTLVKKNLNFSLDPYLKSIREVALSYGFELEINTKIKTNNTPIESAFAKVNTYQTFINLKLNPELIKLLHKDEVVKIKFEVDCNPALGFNIENKWIDMPEYAIINVLDESSLFAGKIHAILCRTYKNNIKGRDYFDFLYYTRKRISPNINYLRNKLLESGKISENDEFNLEVLKRMLKERFESLDYNIVLNDVRKFLFKPENIPFYTKELFLDKLNNL